MPYKSGRLSPRERLFIDRMARTGDAQYAAEKAGYSQPGVRGYQLMMKPAIKSAVLQRAEEVLRDELLPLALERHKMLLTAAGVPAGAQLGAVKLAYDRTLGEDQDKAAKEPSEMTFDELQQSIETLRRQQNLIADQARDVTPDSGVFD
jgi:phage terminase small subunit